MPTCRPYPQAMLIAPQLLEAVAVAAPQLLVELRLALRRLDAI
jgi:hypothetical protein